MRIATQNAIARLKELGWCKYQVVNKQGNRCIVGAFAEESISHHIGIALRRYYATLIGADFTTHISPMAEFNDAPGTTFEKVVDSLEELSRRVAEFV